jgi:hypothetical protein
MPKIKWRDLPPDLLRHLFDRAKEREISMEDLFALEEWRRHSPDAPEGRWYIQRSSPSSDIPRPKRPEACLRLRSFRRLIFEALFDILLAAFPTLARECINRSEVPEGFFGIDGGRSL